MRRFWLAAMMASLPTMGCWSNPVEVSPPRQISPEARSALVKSLEAANAGTPLPVRPSGQP